MTEVLPPKLPDGRAGVAGGFSIVTGWWIRWDGRNDWFPVGADFSAWVCDELRDGDRLVFINHPTEGTN